MRNDDRPGRSAGGGLKMRSVGYGQCVTTTDLVGVQGMGGGEGGGEETGGAAAGEDTVQ